MCFRRMLAGVIGLAVFLGCAQAEDKLTISKEAQEIIDLTNKARAKQKLPPLKPNPLLFKSAKVTAELLAKQKKSEHVINGKDPGQRIDDVKYNWEECGENLADWDRLDPKRIVEGWLNSPVHRAEIMNKAFNEIGIGIVKIGKGDYYYVQHFGRQRGK